jgi:hypothetical protein
VIITSTPDWANFRHFGNFYFWQPFEKYRSSQNLGLHFSMKKSHGFILTKIALGYTLGDFFTKLSGHPDNYLRRLLPISANNLD